jgi:hypothetical protein
MKAVRSTIRLWTSAKKLRRQQRHELAFHTKSNLPGGIIEFQQLHMDFGFMTLFDCA